MKKLSALINIKNLIECISLLSFIPSDTFALLDEIVIKNNLTLEEILTDEEQKFAIKSDEKELLKYYQIAINRALLAKAFSIIVLTHVNVNELESILEGKELINDIYDSNDDLAQAWLNTMKEPFDTTQDNLDLMNSAVDLAHKNRFYINN